MMTLNRRRVVLATVFGILVLGVLILRSRRNPSAVGSVQDVAPATDATSHQAADERNQNPAQLPVGSAQTGTTNQVEKRRQQLELAVSGRNVSITFYGRVVDQDGIPLSGVRVMLSIREWVSIPGIHAASRNPKKELQTDSTGRFALTDATGDDVGIESLTKEGYEPEPTALRGFGYTNSEKHTPDPNNPVLFRMWRRDLKQDLVSGGKSFRLTPDGRVYTIDLVKGALAEGSEADGDMRVTIKRPEEVKLGQHYSWEATICAVSGGLIREMDEYSSMYLAPESGYTNCVQFGHNAVDHPWGDGFSGWRFYLRSRGGKVYGRLTLNLSAYYNNQVPASIRVEYALNPAGSRVLR